MPLNPSGAISLAGPVAGQSIAVELGQSATATISLNDTNVRTLAQVPSGVIVMPTDFWGKSSITNTQKGLFAFGDTERSPVAIRYVNTINYISSSGVVASDTPSVASVRQAPGGATYGGDKAIFGYGLTRVPPSSVVTNTSNLVSNTGVMASDSPGVGTARRFLAATGYGGDKAIFGFGSTPVSFLNMTNLVSNTGVVSSDTPGVGTARTNLAATVYGGDKAIFAYGQSSAGNLNISNLVSNTGVMASDTPGVGTARQLLAATGYGSNTAIFAYGLSDSGYVSISNLLSNTGIIASDTPGVGSVKGGGAACRYGGDKGIFGYGINPSPALWVTTTNLVSNTGVIASDSPSVGLSRYRLGAAGYSTSP